MALSITVQELAVAIRVATGDGSDLGEEDRGILTRQRSVAESIIERYAVAAPVDVKNEAAVVMIGHLYEMPIGQRNHQNAFRQSGAISLLSFWRGGHSQVVDETELTPATQTPSGGSVHVVGGISADATPSAAELTIEATATGVVSFPAFADMHVLLWHPTVEGDLTSVVFQNDPTKANVIGGWTKHAGVYRYQARDGAIWVSNQALTFAAPTDLAVS